MVEPIVKVRIITEDNSKDALEVYTNLFKSILKNCTEGFDSRQVKIPDNESFSFADVAGGNNWRQKRPRDKGLSFRIKEFKREIASYLMNKNSFILWHFDGDMKWSGSKNGTKCQTFQQFQKFIDPILEKTDTPDITKDRFLLLIPFYSIEAWLYQNKAVLKTISRTDDIQKISPEELDEIEKIKEKFTIKAKYNRDLSKQYPFNAVFKLGKSFYQSVLTIQNNSTFLETFADSHS